MKNKYKEKKKNKNQDGKNSQEFGEENGVIKITYYLLLLLILQNLFNSLFLCFCFFDFFIFSFLAIGEYEDALRMVSKGDTISSQRLAAHFASVIDHPTKIEKVRNYGLRLQAGQNFKEAEKEVKKIEIEKIITIK